MADVCCLSATSLSWSRALLRTAASSLSISRAVPLSLGLVVMEVVELVQDVADYCSVVMDDAVHLQGRPLSLGLVVMVVQGSTYVIEDISRTCR